MAENKIHVRELYGDIKVHRINNFQVEKPSMKHYRLHIQHFDGILPAPDWYYYKLTCGKKSAEFIYNMITESIFSNPVAHLLNGAADQRGSQHVTCLALQGATFQIFGSDYNPDAQSNVAAKEHVIGGFVSG